MLLREFRLFCNLQSIQNVCTAQLENTSSGREYMTKIAYIWTFQYLDVKNKLSESSDHLLYNLKTDQLIQSTIHTHRC